MKDLIFFSFGACLGSIFNHIWAHFPEKPLLSSSNPCDLCQHQLTIPLVSLINSGFRFPLCQHKTQIISWFLEVISACLMFLSSQGYLSPVQVLTLFCGLLLSSYDCRDQSFPLSLWFLFFLLSSCLKPWNFGTLCCLALALVSQLKNIGIGAGDFLFLANLSLIFSYQDLVIIIQVSSLAGISYILLTRKKYSIPFLPFLYLTSLFLLSFSLVI